MCGLLRRTSPNGFRLFVLRLRHTLVSVRRRQRFLKPVLIHILSFVNVLFRSIVRINLHGQTRVDGNVDVGDSSNVASVPGNSLFPVSWTASNGWRLRVSVGPESEEEILRYFVLAINKIWSHMLAFPRRGNGERWITRSIPMAIRKLVVGITTRMVFD